MNTHLFTVWKAGRVTLLALASSLLFSGCGIYTKYQRPDDLPTDSLFDKSLALAAPAGTVDEAADEPVSLALLSWRELYRDVRLQSLIEEALQQNTDLLAARQRIKEAEATLLSARLAYLPSFMLTPQGGVSSFDKSKGSWTYTAVASASWEVDIFGRLTNAKRRAKALYLQSRDYEQAITSSLVANVANLYYTLLMLDDQLRISEETAANWHESVKTMKAMMAAGMTNEAAVSQSEATCRQVEASAVGSLVQPIFNKGVNIANLKIAKAQQEEAKLAFRQALLNAGSEVNDALVQVQTARDKAQLRSGQVASLETAVRSTELLMKHGTTTYLEVLTACQGLLSARLSQVADRFSEIQGIINLYQALGGGCE